jgi:hypothetical protein
MKIRSLIKIGVSMMVLAALLTGATYAALRGQGKVNPTSVAGRAARTEVRPVGSDISTVELEGPIDLTLKQGDIASLKVRGEQRLLGNIETSQEGNTLHIGTRGVLFHHRRPIQVELILPSLQELSVNGSGDSSVTGFSGQELAVHLQGSGNLTFNGRYRQIDAGVNGSGGLNLNTGNSEKVNLEMVGSGAITSSGSCKNLKAQLTGSGDLNAEHMASDQVVVTLAGSGTTNVFARQSADLTLHGSGDIRVFGNPNDRNVKRSGSGAVSWER